MLLAVEDGEGAGTAQVGTEGTRVGVRNLEVAHDDFLSEVRNSWISSMSMRFSSWGLTTILSSSHTRCFREANMNDRMRKRIASWIGNTVDIPDCPRPMIGAETASPLDRVRTSSHNLSIASHRMPMVDEALFCSSSCV